MLVNEIYIPLCIYFNRQNLINAFDREIFTFHYVSISTNNMYVVRSITLLFTFHYVSISTLFS